MSVQFSGIVYDYGDEFTQKRVQCMTSKALQKLHRVFTEEVVIDSSEWGKIPLNRHRDVERLLAICSLGAENRFALQATAELARLLRVDQANLPLRVVDTNTLIPTRTDGDLIHPSLPRPNGV